MCEFNREERKDLRQVRKDLFLITQSRRVAKKIKTSHLREQLHTSLKKTWRTRRKRKW